MPLARGVYSRKVPFAMTHVCSERGTGSSVDEYFVKNTILVSDIGKMTYVFFMLKLHNCFVFLFKRLIPGEWRFYFLFYSPGY